MESVFMQEEKWCLLMCEKGRSQPCLASLQCSDIQTGSESVYQSTLAGHHPGFLCSCFRLGRFKHDPKLNAKYPHPPPTASSQSLMTEQEDWTNNRMEMGGGLLSSPASTRWEKWEYDGCSWFTFRAFNCLLLSPITGVLYLFMLPALYVPLGFKIHVPSQSSIILTAREENSSCQGGQTLYSYNSKYCLN